MQTQVQVRKTDAHFVFHGVRFITRRVGDGDVKIAVIARVGRAGEATCDFVAFGDSERCWSVEYCLPKGEDVLFGIGK
jgi:hypothetical protein